MVLLPTPFDADHQFYGTHVPVFLSHWLTESSPRKFAFNIVAFPPSSARKFAAGVRSVYGLSSSITERACRLVTF